MYSFRPVESCDIVIDPATGVATVAEDVVDPLAGEVFDTPEFAASHEGTLHAAGNGDSSDES
ncbi:hypothetical protein [Hoyosella altamirensis]|uniref:hypothetical protein n=1 Tax=Hoyosella altamirensis TaxID=616997 RepID=UPI001E36C6BD|nr:hypothetical protein [Hoyosella altamirensis]